VAQPIERRRAMKKRGPNRSSREVLPVIRKIILDLSPSSAVRKVWPGKMCRV
jgi:hypothetical protein